jgi:hypothetical protein
MEQDFILPTGLVGRFAIVKLWPGIKTAEDECIARLKIAAVALGLECIEIHADGRLLENTDKIITKKDVDFVLHLHYDTPKLYDAFSFVALWNPVQFYQEWGYARTSRNLLTHDDFVSCSSPAADDHVGRLIRKATTHLPPFFNLYHSIADIVHSPSLGDHKLFYAGINWDALRGGISRHQELLKRLDKTGHLRIFGPTLFQEVEVWKGYESYVREIPFDGISMLDEISRAGIALVLSSQAHKDSELMSNRLFESVAAGALVICDENNFAKKFFGDSLLYIDSRCDVEEIFNAIESHLAWAIKNPVEALAMVVKAQAIFKEKFSLRKNLSDLYQGFSNRKLELTRRQMPEGGALMNVCLYLLLPEYSEDVLNAHIASVVAQEYENFSPVLIVDKMVASKYRSSIENTLAKSSVKIDVLEIDFFTYGINKEIKVRRKTGEVIAAVLALTLQADAVIFVAPNEKIFSNHIQVLAGSLIRNPDTNCAATAAILKHSDQPIHGIHERIDFSKLNQLLTIGYARFIFRVSALPNDLNLALPYLDRKVMAILIGNNSITQEIPSTVIIDVITEFPSGTWDEGHENNLIASFSPNAFAISTGHEIILPQLVSNSPEAGMSCKEIKRLSWEWIVIQATLMRRDGLMVRIKELKRKLTRPFYIVTRKS